MDIDEAQISLSTEQKQTLHLMSSVFPKEITENFVKTLVLQNSLSESKSPKKQATLDSWLVKNKSPKAPKTSENGPTVPNSTNTESCKELQNKSSCESEQTPQNDIVNLKSSTSSSVEGSSNNNELNLETGKKALTDTEIVQMGMKNARIVLRKVKYENQAIKEKLAGVSTEAMSENVNYKMEMQTGMDNVPNTGLPVTEICLTNENALSDLGDKQLLSNPGEKLELIPGLGKKQKRNQRKPKQKKESPKVVSKSDVIECAVDSAGVVETVRNLIDHSSHLSHSPTTKILIRRTRHSTRNMSAENSELASSQSNAEEQYSIIEGKDVGDILEDKTPQQKSSPARSKIAPRIIRKRSRSSINSDSSSVTEKVVEESFDLIKKSTNDPATEMLQPVPAKQRTCKRLCRSRTLSVENSKHAKQDSSTMKNNEGNVLESETPMAISSFSIEDLTATEDKGNSDSISPSFPTGMSPTVTPESRKTDESGAVNVPQPVPTKQRMCKTRRKSRTLSIENSSQLNLTKPDASKNNEANEGETSIEVSSFIDENIPKSHLTDEQNSGTLPIVKSPSFIPESGKAEKSTNKPESTVITNKESEPTEEENKEPETIIEGNQMLGLIDGAKESKKKFNKNSKKTKKSNKKLEINEQLNDLLETTVKDNKLPETSDDAKVIETFDGENKTPVKVNGQSEATEKAEENSKSTGKINRKIKTTRKSNKQLETQEKSDEIETTDEANKSKTVENANQLPKATEEIEKKSEVTVKINKKSKSTKKSNQKLETVEKLNEVQEPGNASKENEIIENNNKSLTVTKTTSKKNVKLQNSKLVTEPSQVLDATSMAIAEMDIVSGEPEAKNTNIRLSVDLPSTENIENVHSFEANKLISEDSQCNAASKGPESDEKQKNYEAFCTLQEICSSLGINVEQLFASKKLTKRLKSSVKSDAYAFIQGHRFKNGQTTPSVYMHDSKEQLEDLFHKFRIES